MVDNIKEKSVNDVVECISMYIDEEINNILINGNEYEKSMSLDCMFDCIYCNLIDGLVYFMDRLDSNKDEIYFKVKECCDLN